MRTLPSMLCKLWQICPWWCQEPLLIPVRHLCFDNYLFLTVSQGMIGPICFFLWCLFILTIWHSHPWFFIILIFWGVSWFVLLKFDLLLVFLCLKRHLYRTREKILIVITSLNWKGIIQFLGLKTLLSDHLIWEKPRKELTSLMLESRKENKSPFHLKYGQV